MKKIVIIGSVAAGTSVAAKARRNSEDVEIIVFDKDSDIYTGMIGHNITRGRKIITPEEVIKQNNDLLILDVRSPKQFEVNHVDGAINVPLKMLSSYAKTLDENQKIVTYCNKGTTVNAAQNVLINLGFKQVFNLSGGNKNYQRYKSFQVERKKKN